MKQKDIEWNKERKRKDKRWKKGKRIWKEKEIK